MALSHSAANFVKSTKVRNTHCLAGEGRGGERKVVWKTGNLISGEESS